MDTQLKTAYFGMGCFWCSEAVFQRIKGVESVTSGYSGGDIENPSYEDVCSGKTEHAEVIKVEFNPDIVSFRTLVEIFFAFHDPTQLNRQGNDVGTQYRSVIFYINEEQKQIAEQVKQDLQFNYMNPIVTDITEFSNFYTADESHTNYYNRNQKAPYCQIIIDPKIAKLREEYSSLLKTKV